MTTRNPMNERYQNGDAKPVGKTRKSAASAKPVTKAASSVRMESKKTAKQHGLFGRRKAASGGSSRPERLVPDTPEYKKWRSIWLGVIAAAIVLTLFGLLARYILNMPDSISMALVIVGDLLLVASILMDLLKLSKMRNKYAREVRMSKSKENKEKVREANARARKNANSARNKEVEAVQKAQEEKASKPKKKSLNPFSTKNI